MKKLLLTAIVLMIIVIGCNIEENVSSKSPNYINSLILLPFTSLGIYAVTHLEEFKKFLNGN